MKNRRNLSGKNEYKFCFGFYLTETKKAVFIGTLVLVVSGFYSACDEARTGFGTGVPNWRSAKNAFLFDLMSALNFSRWLAHRCGSVN